MMKKIIFFDTETTWFTPKSDRIIQFWAIYWSYNNETWQFFQERVINQYINPQRQIPKPSMDVRWIKQEFAEMFCTIDSYIKEFCAYIMKSDVIVWHNLGYDMSMLVWEIELLWLKYDFSTWKKQICTMKTWSQENNVKYPKLQNLYTELFWKCTRCYERHCCNQRDFLWNDQALNDYKHLKYKKSGHV